MNTTIWEEKDIDLVAEALKRGEVVCFPTETVYGIGVIATQEAAFSKLVATKRRPPEKPFSMMVANLGQAFQYLEAGEKGKRVMEHFMPGEITVLAKAKEGLPSWVTLGTSILGLRIPAVPFVLALIEKVGEPLLVTSANHSGEPTSVSFEETKKVFDGEVCGIVKGNCHSKQASTIVNIISEDEIKLVREGPIPFAEIKNIWEGKL